MIRVDDRAHVDRLFALAEEHDSWHAASADADGISIRRRWCPEAGTHTFDTHVAVDASTRDRLDVVAEIFFGSADLAVQPWYEQFQGGRSRPCAEPPPPGIDRHQLGETTVDVGLQAPRCYRQRVSLASPEVDVRVIALRAVELDDPPPEGAVLAVTREPTGDVFRWREGRLHWNHVCTTAGVGLLPGPLDRWLIDGLRWLGLDASERRTYRGEADAWRRWVPTLAGSDGDRRSGAAMAT